MSRLLLLFFVFSTSMTAYSKVTIDDVNRDMNNLAAQNKFVTQAQIDQQWLDYNDPPNESKDWELEARTATNGYVILNKSQGLIKQWGRINLPANSLGQHRISFPKRMNNVFSVTVSSSDPYTSAGCKNCVIETGARVKSHDSSGFNITNGFVGDGKGGVYAVTLYWEVIGKL
ncbi:hypothetical protein KFZ68_20660 (plasmid) [Photobacterium damselae]|uniref:hypothetical protein n=1 Tax=Photobacterium damselae TaxID=38293 RepID=UPI002543198B